MPAGVATPGSMISQPPGLEAFWIFNGLTMNDRSSPDRIRIKSIDGLQKLQIRDRREDKPSDHGELPYNSYLSGRTILMTGVVESSNIEKMRDMLMSLRKAFAVFTEKPLVGSRPTRPDRDVQIYCKPIDTAGLEEQSTWSPTREFQVTFRASDPTWKSTTQKNYSQTFGFLDDFSTNTAPQYTAMSGALTVTGGSARPTSLTFNGYRNDLNYKFADDQLTIRLLTPATITAGDYVSLILKRIDNNNYLYARIFFVTATTARVDIVKVVSGTGTILVSGSTFTVAAATTYWLVASIIGSIASVRPHNSDPNITPSPIAALTTFTLTGTDNSAFGTGLPITGPVPYGDVGFIISSTSGIYTVDDFRAEPMSLTYSGLVQVVNAGIFLAEPIIRVYGPATSIQIRNDTLMPDETVARSIIINGTIPAGGIPAANYYEYNSATGTLVDQYGNNKFAQLDVASKPIQLRDGVNSFTIIAASASGTPRVDILMQDTWI